ncbi:TPA: Bro-N domain-containing protein [Citrobacter amalonaticus]
MFKYKNCEAPTTCDSQGFLSNRSHAGNIDINIVAKSDFNFHGVILTPVEKFTGIWLTSADIAKALEYKSTKSISNLFAQYEDEFSQGMTMVIESVTNGINGSTRRMKVRVFSLRGAHLIAMFARTRVAKEFRRWVLDILEREVEVRDAGNLPADFHQRVMLYLDSKGGVIGTYPLTEEQIVMSLDGFVQFFRRKGWLVAPKEEVAKGLIGAIQSLP